ncbi:hypothetical protein [Rubripirellula lacrimiformis]|uniref:hypothetical protein n=1 Tax=Rubripirellula lacrimiformis TaxID=1930273 RepID=UPI00119D5508|nr:hypothetical protein [Rubripirellula lacrimiformis]
MFNLQFAILPSFPSFAHTAVTGMRANAKRIVRCIRGWNAADCKLQNEHFKLDIGPKRMTGGQHAPSRRFIRCRISPSQPLLSTPPLNLHFEMFNLQFAIFPPLPVVRPHSGDGDASERETYCSVYPWLDRGRLQIAK